MAEKYQLKDLINKKVVIRIGKTISRSYSQFREKEFIQSAFRNLNKLELKARVSNILDTLHLFLPNDFSRTAEILSLFPENWKVLNTKEPVSEMGAWSVIDYVGQYGVNSPDISLPLLEKLTPLFTAEFAIRPFLIHHEKLTLSYLRKWVLHRDLHVRRLVSEGTRPRLPWGVKLQQYINDPSPVFPFLEALKDDPSLYVRRSVANHLNDISKDNPDKALELGGKWLKNSGKYTLWVVQKGFRSLIKKGNPKSLSLLGYGEKAEVKLTHFIYPEKGIKIGESADFGFTLHSTSKREQSLMVDFAVHYRKKRGEFSRKVFKLSSFKLNPGESRMIKKKINFNQMTTRRHYPGEHFFEPLINGQSFEKKNFIVFNA